MTLVLSAAISSGAVVVVIAKFTTAVIACDEYDSGYLCRWFFSDGKLSGEFLDILNLVSRGSSC